MTPRPLRHIPVLIGGSGEKRSLPTVARHADIWHSFPLPIDEYRRKSTLIDELAAQARRDGTAIERSVAATAPFSTGFDRRSADEFREAGVTLFTLELQPTDGGYDFEPLEQAIAWRDGASD